MKNHLSNWVLGMYLVMETSLMYYVLNLVWPCNRGNQKVFGHHGVQTETRGWVNLATEYL